VEVGRCSVLYSLTPLPKLSSTYAIMRLPPLRNISPTYHPESIPRLTFELSVVFLSACYENSGA